MAQENHNVKLEGSHFEIVAQKAAIDALLKMPKEDRDAMIAFAKLAAGDRSRLSKIIKNGKALSAIADNWAILEMQFS